MNFIVSGSGVSISVTDKTTGTRDVIKHLTIRLTISHYLFIVFGTKCLSPAVFEIMGTKHIVVTTSIFQGQVTSSVTRPFDSPYPISRRCFIVTKSVFPAAFEILDPKHIAVKALTSLGHATSSVT